MPDFSVAVNGRYIVVSKPNGLSVTYRKQGVCWLHPNCGELALTPNN